jgi:Na+-transporting NADH:ubiquinone oxidoreductase subunit A
MKWKIQLVGDDFDLKELEKSFSNSSNYSITKENDGYYLSSSEFDSCKEIEEIKNKLRDILDVLNGAKISKKGYIGAFDNQITVIPEGDYYEMFGWMKPGFNKFSVSKMFLAWLKPNREWRLDTALHGGVRPFVLTDKLNKVFPMDILPIQFIKACLAEDIDMLEKLGIYEVIEEDFALCEVVSETKMDFQEIVRKAINLMINEVG